MINTTKILLVFCFFVFMCSVEITLACHETPVGRPACPALTIRGSDEIYVVYMNLSPREIFFTHSPDGGKNWSFPINISNSVGESTRPSIAANADGKIYVTWGDNTDGKYNVLLRSTVNGGVSWTPIINVTSDMNGSNRLPSITVDSNNRINIAWTNRSRKKVGQTTIVEREVFLKYSLDEGSTWSAAYSVSRRPSSSDISRADMSVDAANNVYILWEEDTQENFEIYMSKGTNHEVNE